MTFTACARGAHSPFAVRPARRMPAPLAASFGALALLGLAACGPARSGGASDRVEILDIAPAELDPSDHPWPEADSCKARSLSKRQAAAFFAASREYPGGTPRAFYWVPCTQQGRLRAQGRVWEFQINAAATGLWRDGDAVRYWGCSAKVCADMGLLMPETSEP